MNPTVPKKVDMTSKKYLVCPGYKLINGGRKYISSVQLINKYNLKEFECVIVTTKTQIRALGTHNLIIIEP